MVESSECANVCEQGGSFSRLNRGGHDACVMCAHTNLLLLLLLATVVTYSEPVGISNVCTV